MTPNDAIPRTTDREAFRVQGSIYARIGGSARADIAFRLTDVVRRIAPGDSVHGDRVHRHEPSRPAARHS